MITAYILGLIVLVISTIIKLANTMFQPNTLITDVNNFISTILTITTQAHNFMYFIFGNTLVIVVPITIAMLVTKYTVVPILQIFRSHFSNSNDQ